VQSASSYVRGLCLPAEPGPNQGPGDNPAFAARRSALLFGATAVLTHLAPPVMASVVDEVRSQ